MKIVFHPASREEALEGYLYYGAEDDELALDFEHKIQQTLALIQSQPELHRIRRYNVRRVNLPRFKERYIAYMIWQNEIVVVAIGHAKRRPYYWYRRPKQYRDQTSPS
jgi:plasmid stabilization system protein ParE